MKIFYFFHFKVIAGKPQRIRKNAALSFLALACMFLRCSNFLCHFLRMHYFCSVLYNIQLSFLETCILERGHWRHSKIIGIKCFNLLFKDNEKIYKDKKISQWGWVHDPHSIAPSPPEKYIFFALPSINGPLPAELKCRENTAVLSILSKIFEKAMFKHLYGYHVTFFIQFNLSLAVAFLLI